MKFISLIVGALAFGSAVAAPLADPRSVVAVESRDLIERAKSAGRKYNLGNKAPAVGKTGVHTSGGVTHIHYGDDVKVHGSHVAYHEKTYPQHAGKPFKLATGTNKKGEIADNRKAALRKIKSQGSQHVRDEKPLASLSHGAKRTTVMKVPKKESLIEAQLAKEAKRQAVTPGNKGLVILHDNRTNKKTKPLGPILKKRDLIDSMIEERGLIDDAKDKLKHGADDLKNKTESGLEGAKNATEDLASEFLGKFDDFESKFKDLLSKVGDDIKEAGDDFVTAIEQLAFGGFDGGHQLGSFYQGMHNFDAVEQAAAAGNGTDKPSDEDLAHDQAAIDVYYSGFANASHAIGNDLMDDFFKLSDLVTGNSDDDSSSANCSSQYVFLHGDDSSDDSDSGSSSNSTSTGSSGSSNSTMPTGGYSSGPAAAATSSSTPTAAETTPAAISAGVTTSALITPTPYAAVTDVPSQGGASSGPAAAASSVVPAAQPSSSPSAAAAGY